MEVHKRTNSRDDHTDECRSFGSNGLPYCQSQKISIGVMAERSGKINSGLKDDEAVLKTAQKEASSGKFAEEKFKGSASVYSVKRKHAAAPEATIQGIFTSTKSLHQPTETVQFHKKVFNEIVNKKSKSVKETPIENTFQLDKSHTSGKKKIGISSSGRKRKTGRNIEKLEELAPGAVLENNELNKGEPEKKTANHSSGVLRMKLSEILGSTPSPTKNNFQFEAPCSGVKEALKPEEQFDQKGIRARNPRQNSDTIETDSESLNKNIRRPVTRSLTRKKVPSKSQQKNNYKISNAEDLPNSLRSGYGRRRVNIFSFSEAEVWSRSLHFATNFSSSSLMLKNRDKNHNKVEQGKICFSQVITPEKSKQATEKGRTSTEKFASHGTDGFCGRSCQDDKEHQQSIGIMKEIHSPAKKRTYEHEDLHAATNINASFSILKNIERDHGRVEQQKTCFSQMSTPEKIQQTTEKGRKKSASLQSDGFHGHSCPNDEEHLKSINGIIEEIHHCPPKKGIYQDEDINSPQLQVEAEPKEDFHCQPSKENEDPKFDVNTQTLGMESPLTNNSPDSPMPKDTKNKQSVYSPPAAERWHVERDFSSFKSLWTSKAGVFQRDLETDDYEKLNTASPRKLFTAEEERESGDRMSQSSSEEQNVESFDQGPNIKEGSKTMTMWPKRSDYCKIPSMLHTNKRLEGRGSIRIKESHSSSPSLEGTQVSNGLEGPSDGDHEDSSSSAMAHFALALERFRNKMKSVVVKRSTELLTSVAEDAQLQLENVELQIARDEKKFRSLEDSKSKILEKKFQEQQEILNLIQKKFKEEINKHEEDCKRILEELEIYQREQKGNAGKLKSLHRKVVLQVEERIAGQLSDAERRIISVQKAASQKMSQLRHAIIECLKEGVDSW